MKQTPNRTVVVFDFDGTLTTKDTFLLFIRYSCGATRFIFGMALYSPLIILMMLRLYPNWKCKEQVFSYFFKGMPYEDFKRLGEDFGNKFCNIIIRPSMKERLQWHLSQGHKVYVISASIEEWVKPFFRTLGDVTVLATKARPDLSGFASNNCYGQEKVERLLKAEPDRANYYLYAYGDSRGDREMLAFSDSPTFVK